MLGKAFSALGNMFGGQSPQFTPPIMPQGGQPQGQSVGGMFAKPKLTTAQKIQGLGALLRDAGDMGLGRSQDHFGRFQSGAQEQMAQAQQQQNLNQMLGGQSGQGGFSPQMIAAARANPAAFAKALADRQLGIHQITGGNSVYNPQTNTSNGFW